MIVIAKGEGDRYTGAHYSYYCNGDEDGIAVV